MYDKAGKENQVSAIATKTLTVEEADKLLGYCGTRRHAGKNRKIIVRNRAMILLMLDAGLRVGEVVQLLRTDLFIMGEPVTSLRLPASITKSKRERIVPMSARLRGVIRDMNDLVWLLDASQLDHFAFYSQRTLYHITTRQVERIVGNISEKAFGRAINPHALRHTFASRLMRTTSIRIVQELLGHANMASTQIYTHPNGDDLTAAIAGMQ